MLFFTFYNIWICFLAGVGVSLSEANELMKKNKKGKLPVIDDQKRIVALISRTGELDRWFVRQLACSPVVTYNILL